MSLEQVGELWSKTASAPRLLTYSKLCGGAVARTLKPESLGNWIARLPVAVLPPYIRIGVLGIVGQRQFQALVETLANSRDSYAKGSRFLRSSCCPGCGSGRLLLR